MHPKEQQKPPQYIVQIEMDAFGSDTEIPAFGSEYKKVSDCRGGAWILAEDARIPDLRRQTDDVVAVLLYDELQGKQDELREKEVELQGKQDELREKEVELKKLRRELFEMLSFQVEKDIQEEKLANIEKQLDWWTTTLKNYVLQPRSVHENCVHGQENHNGMPWESDSEIGKTLHWRNWINLNHEHNYEPALRTAAASWYIRLFLNEVNDEFVHAVAGTHEELNWAHMYTIHAKRQGICSQCRRCGQVMRIAWGRDSSFQHMAEARATICAWLEITYQKPPGNDGTRMVSV